VDQRHDLERGARIGIHRSLIVAGWRCRDAATVRRNPIIERTIKCPVTARVFI